MKINTAFVEKVLTRFIHDELAKFGYSKGILGLSGGLDSAVCAALAVRALGSENVLGLIMPYGKSQAADVKDALDLAQSIGLKTEIMDISPQIDEYFRLRPTESRLLKGNKMARERMSILYDFSAREKCLILGTSNKTELLIGYGTIHGDMACAINPLGDLYKTQVRALAAHLGLPERFILKPPTAGLWPGQTDEDEIGMTYEKIDSILYELVDKRLTPGELIDRGFEKDIVEKIVAMVKKSEFKRKLPPIAKISARTIGHDFLYPFDWDK